LKKVTLKAQKERKKRQRLYKVIDDALGASGYRKIVKVE
jgi:hypothetical protein